MAKWAATTDKVIDKGFGGGKRATPRGAVLHHGAGADVLGYVANANSRDSHPTYHVASSGRVTGVVHPDRRPFSTAHGVDNLAITFEIDNSKTGGDWPVSDAALNAVVDVIVDHARQAGYSKVALNKFNENQAGKEFFIAWHSQYTSTACPGPYVMGKRDWIVAECNHRLAGEPSTKTVTVKAYGEIRPVAVEHKMSVKNLVALNPGMDFYDATLDEDTRLTVKQTAKAYTSLREAAIDNDMSVDALLAMNPGLSFHNAKVEKDTQLKVRD